MGRAPFLRQQTPNLSFEGRVRIVASHAASWWVSGEGQCRDGLQTGHSALTTPSDQEQIENPPAGT